MSAKAIYEGAGKALLNQFLTGRAMKNRFAIVEESVNWSQLVQDNPWLNEQVCEKINNLIIGLVKQKISGCVTEK